MLDWLVGHRPDFLDHDSGEARRCLSIDHHHAVIADDHTSVGISLGCKGPQIAAYFGKADLFFRHITLRGKFLRHRISPLSAQSGQKHFHPLHHRFLS